MTGRDRSPERAREALAQRLRVATSVILADVPKAVGGPSREAANALVLLSRQIHLDPRPEHVWLLLTALAAALPTPDEVRATLRRLELSTPGNAAAWLLEEGFRVVMARGAPHATMELARDVVADVDFSARHDLHTGIQRVVREVCPRWERQYRVRFVAWTSNGGAMRDLRPLESARVLRWAGSAPQDRDEDAQEPPLVVPWATTVILCEVPTMAHCAPLAALAEFSGSRLSGIGYDCIPIVSADLLPPAEAEKFVKYLSVIKHSSAVAAISVSAKDEFEGFARMLPTQGLRGPRVEETPLPVHGPAAPSVEAPRTENTPVVLSVGSLEPRKNHVAVLYAAERLWREGLPFRLLFIGNRGWTTREFDRWVSTLVKRRRPVEVRRSVPDRELWDALRTSRFMVFPSLHEGFGLPVAEAIAVGTPAITSNFGSMREIAELGGVITVDPRDLDELTDAMRRLLTDHSEWERLARGARERPTRTWDDYARETWKVLTSGTAVSP